MEKKESQKEDRVIKPVMTLPIKKWVLKIGFLNVQFDKKYQKAKI